jgi:hypothetical protein
VNEYVTKFTQLSRYTLDEVDTDEKKHECFLNGRNDGLVYALEARDFENFQGMVNKTLVLENRRGVNRIDRISNLTFDQSYSQYKSNSTQSIQKKIMQRHEMHQIII